MTHAVRLCVFCFRLFYCSSILRRNSRKHSTKRQSEVKVTFKRWIIIKLNKFCYFVYRQIQSVDDFESCLNQGSSFRRSQQNLLGTASERMAHSRLIWEFPEHLFRESWLRLKAIIASFISRSSHNSKKPPNLEIDMPSVHCAQRDFNFPRTFFECERNNIIHSEKGHVMY